MKFVCDPSFLQQIRTHVLQACPEEACGVLVGSREGNCYALKGMFPSKNLANDKRREFLLDPVVQMQAQRESRQQGGAILGYYHSHPGSPAMPSAGDRAWAESVGQELLWMICSVSEARVGDIRIWQWSAEQGFQKVVLEDQESISSEKISA